MLKLQAPPGVFGPMVDERGQSDHKGGEWQLLLARLSDWLNGVDPSSLWQQSQQPLRLAALALVALIVLKVYGAVLDTVNGVPLMGGLLELVGLIWLTRFASERLLRSDDRQALLNNLEQRWRQFRGNN